MNTPLLAPRRALLTVALLASTATHAWAAWPTDPMTNVPICTSTGSQSGPTVATDGSGGAIITWYDNDIYAQHVMANGIVDPAWPANGRLLCGAASVQQMPAIVADGSGGAIVTWKDLRGGTDYDLYAQHVLANGTVDPSWPADGCAVCTAANTQEQHRIVADGAGGAIITWQDLRDAVDYDIYAQHVLASGIVDPAWPADGTELCTAIKDQFVPSLVTDGDGGAIVAWYDLRLTNNRDIYAQHVQSDGAVDPAWPVDGLVVCGATGDQTWPVIVSDNAGGAIVAWEDHRVNEDVYAQHVQAGGIVDPAWPVDGTAVCAAADDQFNLAIVTDGADGAIVAWQDYRSGTEYDVYAQRVQAGGAVDPAWPVNGRAVSNATNDQQIPTAAADGAGGVIVTWFDLRNGTHQDVYAQRVLANGTTDPSWPVGGRVISSAAGDQAVPTIVADASGGAIVTWEDTRGVDQDIYAQRVAPDGNLGGAAITSAASLTCSSVGAVCSEHLSPVDASGQPAVVVGKNGFVNFTIDASCGDSPCSGLCKLTPTGQPAGASWPSTYGPMLSASSRAMGPFTVPGVYSYVMSCSPGITGIIEVVNSTASTPRDAVVAFSLDPVQPNPGSGAARIAFTLPTAGPATLAIFDVTGRKVRRWSWTQLPAGLHELRWDGRTDEGHIIAPGVLYARLQAGGRTLEQTMIHLR